MNIWFLLPVLLIIFWVVSVYNFFVSSKVRIKGAVQEIGNQLKRQAELIPNLESSVKGFMKQETSIFKMLTDARRDIASASKSGDLTKMTQAGSRLAEVLPKLQVIVESNPELKSSEVVSNLMDELRDTADKVMYARRLVIDLTADYNVRLVSLPDSLLAKTFGFTELPGLITPDKGAHLEVKESDTKTPKINL